MALLHDSMIHYYLSLKFAFIKCSTQLTCNSTIMIWPKIDDQKANNEELYYIGIYDRCIVCVVIVINE